jgi:hypothetical protein
LHMWYDHSDCMFHVEFCVSFLSVAVATLSVVWMPGRSCVNDDFCLTLL